MAGQDGEYLQHQEIEAGGLQAECCWGNQKDSVSKSKKLKSIGDVSSRHKEENGKEG